MKSLVWFLFGVIGGFVGAHVVNKDPRGHEALAQIDARIAEFTDRMADAYREQEAKFAGTIDGAKDAASHTFAAVKDAASDVIGQAKTAATQAVGTAKDVVDEAAEATTDAATDAPESDADADEASDEAEHAASDSSVPTPRDVAEHTTVHDVNALAESEDSAEKN